MLISTRDRIIAKAVSSSLVSFECVDALGSKAKEILSRAAFGDDLEEITPDWNADSEYVEILKVWAGLALALGIAGSGVNLEYEDSKYASFSIKNYCSGLMSGALHQLQGANVEYHAGALKCVVEASLKLCEKWGFIGERNIDMRRLFRSLCVLYKQQIIQQSTLEQYWGLYKRQMQEIVRKFRDLNIAKRDLLKKSTSNNGEVSEFHVHMHDLVLDLRHWMVVDEKEKWHLRLIDSYRLTLQDDKEMETQSKDWWNVKDDGCV